MTDEVFALALAAGRAAIDRLEPETRLVILGEMGIANSTLAAALAAALLGAPADVLTGPGTGVEGAALEGKRAVVREMVARAPANAPPAELLRELGGRELAALVGAAARAIERRMAVLVDGFIVSAALLALVRSAPAASPFLLFAHRSAEPGHAAVLTALGAQPLLDLGLRLGEGSGALAAFPLVEAAVELHRGMATFASAGVPDREET
jgi:nicotinate-nucleotide--dimethylbenzimidazole phosphoribosyltransferase